MSTKIYDQLEHLELMDCNLSVYNNSNTQALGTCTILLVSPVYGNTYDVKLYTANHNGNVLLLCHDYCHMQKLYPVFIKCLPKSAFLTSIHMMEPTVTSLHITKNTSLSNPAKGSCTCKKADHVIKSTLTH